MRSLEKILEFFISGAGLTLYVKCWNVLGSNHSFIMKSLRSHKDVVSKYVNISCRRAEPRSIGQGQGKGKGKVKFHPRTGLEGE